MSWIQCDNWDAPVEIDDCLKAPDTSRQVQSKKTSTITHNKNINSTLTVGTTNIPIRIRQRTFNMAATSGSRYEDYKVILDLQFYEHECYKQISLWELSVSENAVWTDSGIYILDTEHNNAFWQEVVYTCSFSGSSKEKTWFHHPSWEASKLRINTVNYNITRTWKLMINGIVETIFSESYVKSLYSQNHPLFFVYPLPMSGETTDPDFGPVGEVWNGVPCKGYSFLDYRTGGLGPSVDEIKSGGQDYYYPEYLWYMGDHREEDQADAEQRFNDNYGSITNVKVKEVRNLPFPHIWGPEDPRGSIVRDYAGNTFASVTVTKINGDMLHFNRFVNSEGTSIAIPETIPGSGVRYYPVGLI